MLLYKGLDAALAKLKKQKAMVTTTITKGKKSLVKAVLTDLVKGTPQWSGNLTQGWYVEFHGRTGAYRQKQAYQAAEDWTYKSDPYKAGDNPAVGYTLRRELKYLESLRWNSKVTITNYVPYASEVENNQGPTRNGVTFDIRDENKLASYGGVAMVGYVTAKYRNAKVLKSLL